MTNPSPQLLSSIQSLIDYIISKSSTEVKIGMLLEKVQQLIAAYQQALANEAQAKTDLATALANDAADAQAIADAQAAAQAAQTKADEAAAQISSLQATVDADTAEDAQIVGAIEAVLPSTTV